MKIVRYSYNRECYSRHVADRFGYRTVSAELVVEIDGEMLSVALDFPQGTGLPEHEVRRRLFKDLAEHIVSRLEKS